MSALSRRIALFTGNYNHIADGVSLTLNRLVAYLERRGDHVLVFGPTIDTPPVQHSGTLFAVPSVRMPGRPEYRISLGLPHEAREALAAFQPDLVHIATPDLLGQAALKWAQTHRVPVVASYHTHFASYLAYYRAGWLEDWLWSQLRRFYAHCAHIYVPSESMADELRAHGIRQGLRIWARGVEVERFSPDRRSEDWRAAQGFAPEEVVVVFVGRLVWEKAVGLFAEVILTLEAEGVPHRSLVVGDGPVMDELRTRLPQTVFTGHQGGDDLAVAYASSDVFFFPSASETFGNVTLEAMASGLPAVCADATGSRSLVVPGETGFLAPPGDAPAFAAALRSLLTDAELRHRMARAGRDRALRFAWPMMLDRLSGYYDEVLADRPAPRLL